MTASGKVEGVTVGLPPGSELGLTIKVKALQNHTGKSMGKRSGAIFNNAGL
jgi:hypothetical protein